VPVELDLLVGKAAVAEILDLGRKVREDQLFRPAELERMDELLQRELGLRLLALLDRVQEGLLEVVVRAEIAGHEKVEEVLELAQMVLHRGTGETDPDPARKPAGGP